MVNLLFVCLGNICRSPMAEAIMRHKVKKEKLENDILIDSAGLGHWHVGNPPHEGTRSLLAQKKIDDTGMQARQVTAEDLHTFDMVVAMDTDNLEALQEMEKRSPQNRVHGQQDRSQKQEGQKYGKVNQAQKQQRQRQEKPPEIVRLLDFLPSTSREDVPDPYLPATSMRFTNKLTKVVTHY